MSQEKRYTNPAHNDNCTALKDVSITPYTNIIADFLERVVAEKKEETTKRLLATIETKQKSH